MKNGLNMPTPEEIKNIAREYARCTCIGTFDAQQRAEDEKVEYDFALPVIEWLSERYCLVEKSDVINEYREHKEWEEALSRSEYDSFRLIAF
ncbi:MAG: hypothetical protein K2N48_01085 [Muribaculaceae bacterium]|nr:hypothetical protein [Muribaculaceae bacterium]